MPRLFAALLLLTLRADCLAPERFLSKGSRWPGSKSIVAEHMAEQLTTLAPDATLKEAAKAMNAARVTGAPVVDASGSLLGVLSRTDLLRQVALGPEDGDDYQSILQDIESRPVSEVMSTKIATISPDATILKAAKVLAEQKFNRLMVTDDESGKLLVIISTTDVVRCALCDEVSEVSQLYDDLSRDNADVLTE